MKRHLIVPSLVVGALSSAAVPSTAFTSPLPTGSRWRSQGHGSYAVGATRPYHVSTSALAAAGRQDGDGILGKIKKAAKSILPSSWFQSEKEKQAAIERSRRQQEIKGSLKEMLSDAPLPVRMMGGLAANVFSSALSSMAETFQEQKESVDALLAQADRAIVASEAVVSALGAPVRVSRQPFSQSSSTTSINGKTTTRVQLGFSVTGSMQSGVAQLTADGVNIQQLVVQVGGRVIPVDPSSARKGPVGARAARGDDDIIEAEIIEKKTKLK